MKILILSNKGNNHSKKCAEGLLKLGHEILYVTLNDKRDNCVKIIEGIQSYTLRYGGAKGYLLNCLEFRRLCRKYKPDIVNVHYASGCGMLSLLSGQHPFLSCYGSDIFDFPNKSIIHAFILKKILRSAKVIASTSNAMADEIKKLLCDKSTFIAITPFGVDINRFKNLKANSLNPRPVVGTVKNLFPIYDIQLLIKGFSIVCKKLTIKPLLYIYGDGPLKEELIQLTTSLGIENDVVFCGLIENKDVPKALSNIDVFVNCSKQESFGVNILEAMACELPVIATDCVGPRELMKDGKCGVILKDREPETLANAILTLLNDCDLRMEYGKAGRIRVLESYDWNKNLLDLEKAMLSE